jgi:hypothetical protein
MCDQYTPQGFRQYTSMSFSGDVTMNGKTTKYTGQSLPFPAGWTTCYSFRQTPNMLSITTSTPNGSTTNGIRDVAGRISGTMNVPTAGGFFSLTLKGTARFS